MRLMAESMDRDGPAPAGATNVSTADGTPKDHREKSAMTGMCRVTQVGMRCIEGTMTSYGGINDGCEMREMQEATF